MNALAVPFLSIGFPVYNGGTDLTRAVDSLLAQTYTDFELIISDNASTDQTEEVCRRYAELDPRIRYVRQPRNLGAGQNFAYVLQEARAPLFQWAAADDRWDPRFIEANVAMLDRHADAVCSISRGSMGDTPLDGTYPLTGTVAENVETYLRAPGDNSRFYGVFRTEVIRKCMVSEEFMASDWYIVLRSLQYGTYREVPEPLFWRGVHGISSRYREHTRMLSSNALRFLFVFAPFTVRVLRDPAIPKTPGTLYHLLRWNVKYLLTRVNMLAGPYRKMGARS
jgi:glycosyltransferase involved in cell wall biosynthesis